MKRKIYKNLLVQYKGGLYDGCFWEWNFFLFDAKGKFHVLTSSGYRGIKTEDTARALLNDAPGAPAYPGAASEYYTYRLNVKKDLKEFENETNEGLVGKIVDAVNRIYKKPIMFWTCNDCGHVSHDNEYGPYNEPSEYKWVTKLCGDCACNYSCGYCGARVEPDGSELTESGCIYCHPDEKTA